MLCGKTYVHVCVVLRNELVHFHFHSAPKVFLLLLGQQPARRVFLASLHLTVDQPGRLAGGEGRPEPSKTPESGARRRGENASEGK